MPFIDLLGLSAKEKESLGDTVGRFKSVGDFLADAIEAFKDVDFPEAITQASPWVGVLGSALSDAIPPVRFLVTVFAKLTEEKDPEALGYLACTLAYQRSVEQAFRAIGTPKSAKKLKAVLGEIKKDDATLEDLNFKTFAFGSALQHPFIRVSDEKLGQVARAVGYPPSDVTQIVGDVHIRFVSNLKTILSHGSTKTNFEPFTQLMRLKSVEERAYAALLEHVDYQRRQFEEMPVLGKEPFALTHVYAETECGVLEWGTIRDSIKGAKTGSPDEEKIDPFSEMHGGRENLTKTVMGLIRDPHFSDAIVVQGVAGSGKSSFTLNLCAELVHHGLRPIRVRLRDLRLDLHVSEALPQAVRFHDDSNIDTELPVIASDELFLQNRIFDEKITVGDARICPWVIILDGWDEVSVSVAEGFKQRVERLLNQVRAEYLNPTKKVRVILTGRPSTAVTESTFLRTSTPVLTLRPLSPKALRSYTEKLASALKAKPITCPNEDPWVINDPARFKPILDQYEQDFKVQSGSMEVLGLPLLTHLAMRLMSQWRGDLGQIVANSTTLYRKLVDLTCHGAKTKDVPFDAEGRALFVGNELRLLLRKTAEAMTVYGQESIPFQELALRLEEGEGRLLERVQRADREHVLTSLMVSYFFKGGHTHLGAEFSHKSFREYLFAEHVIETLKGYGEQQPKAPPEREKYWEDFDQDDPRHRFSRELARMLASQWLSPEVVRHIESLIEWEISRGCNSEIDDLGEPTRAIQVQQWAVIRDVLADLWDWWGEGVHMRPQPERKPRGQWNFGKTFADELVDWSMPQYLSDEDSIPIPGRTISMDAHLGDCIFRLTALVHFHIAAETGWLAASRGQSGEVEPDLLWSGVSAPEDGPRRYQSSIERDGKTWVLFAPSGENSQYLQNYIGRVDAAGWRPQGPFPYGTTVKGIDARNAQISVNLPIVDGAFSKSVDWSFSNLSDANLVLSCMWHHRFRYVLALAMTAHDCVFAFADFRYAVLTGSTLSRAYFGDETDLRHTVLDSSRLQGAYLQGTDLRHASFADANLESANLDGAKLDGAYFRGADLDAARLLTDDLVADQLNEATLSERTILPGSLVDSVVDQAESAA